MNNKLDNPTGKELLAKYDLDAPPKKYTEEELEKIWSEAGVIYHRPVITTNDIKYSIRDTLGNVERPPTYSYSPVWLEKQRKKEEE